MFILTFILMWLSLYANGVNLTICNQSFFILRKYLLHFILYALSHAVCVRVSVGVGV